MNFFAAKERAKKNTFWLIVLFGIGLVATIILINIIFMFFFAYTGQINFENFSLQFVIANFVKISFFVLLIVFTATLSKMNTLRGGGKVVAESLGGKLLYKNSKDLNELKVLNVVDEMAIASGSLSIPVYLLPDDSINAFAAGYSMEDAVIGITKGATEKLNRQELQGVIAHEFSHIFNGDMKLNIKTTALLNGILVFDILGQKLISFAFETSGTTSRIINLSKGKRDSGKSMQFGLLGLGIALFIVGFVGTFVGNIIKSLISKQREYLADASAVGYTRDTSGIAGALKKIGGDSSLIASPSAAIYSHFYFASGVSSYLNINLQTHPPLKKRIYRIEPNWDGIFIKPKPLQSTQQKNKTQNQTSSKNNELDKLYKILGSASVISALNDSGNITRKEFNKAQETIGDIPHKLYTMTQECFSAQALILGLMARHYDEITQEQLNALMLKDRKLFNQMKKTFNPLLDLNKDRHLVLLQLSFPTLKEMSTNQYKTYRALLLEWIYANKKVSFFEWILKYIIIRPLDIYFELESAKKPLYSKIEKVSNEVAFFGSFLATLSTHNIHEAKTKYDKALAANNLENIGFMNIYEINFTLLDEIFAKLLLADYGIKKRLLEIAIECLSVEDKVSPKYQEMLQAIALSFKVPLNLHVQTN